MGRWHEAAFTAKMNATARRLGMTATSYTDASGLDSSTTSTAADQVRLGSAVSTQRPDETGVNDSLRLVPSRASGPRTARR